MAQKPSAVQHPERKMPSLVKEEACVKNYGGIMPKKAPLISKDHVRAFFDSADWALGKQGALKSSNEMEALPPKLQPTPPHEPLPLRRFSYATQQEDGGGGVVASKRAS